MTKAVTETIELPSLKDDYSFHPTLVPGDPTYERLRISNPQKLKRMITEEKLAEKVMNTPESLAFLREAYKQSQDTLRHEYATRGPFYYQYQEAIKQRKQKAQATQADRDILGLAPNMDLTKREVRNAYRRKARKLHPDVGGDAEAFKQLYAAYRNTLSVIVE